MTERVAIYVDGSNVYFAQKEALGWWIDWPRFLDAMREGRDVVSARWYQAYRTEPEPEQNRFLHHLALIGFAVRKKLLKQVFDRNSGGSHLKGSLNLDLAIDALNDIDHYDTAILVSGDSEFEPLIEALHARGKRVIVMATSQNVAIELRNAVGVNYQDLSDLREAIESGKRAGSTNDTDEKRFVEAAQPEVDDSDVYDEDDSDVYDEDDSDVYDDDDEYDDEYDDEEEYEDYEEAHFAAGPGMMPPAVPDPEDVELPLEGEIVRCKVQTVKRYGAFLDLHQHAKTLLHVKDMNRGFVPDAAEFYQVGQEVAVQVVSIDRTKQPPEVRVQVTTAEMEY
jgi:uncharacterized LabA/DUF88 family protein